MKRNILGELLVVGISFACVYGVGMYFRLRKPPVITPKYVSMGVRG